MKKAAYYVFAVLTVVTVLLFFCIFVSADTDNIYVMHNIGSFEVSNNINNTLHAFEETNEGWDTDNANGYVTVSESVNCFPYKLLNDNGSLIYRRKGVKNGEDNYISKKYEQPLDLTAVKYVILPINCLKVDGASYKVSVEMLSGWKKFISEKNIEPECWNGVFVDISSWEDRKKVDTIKISVSLEGDNNLVSDFEYCIDSVYLSDNENIVNAFALSANNYTLPDGSSVAQNGKAMINSPSNSFYLDAQGFAYKTLGEANCLRIDFSTESAVLWVGLHTYNSSGGEADEVYAEAERSGNLYTVYLPVANKDISNIRLSFELAEQKYIEITSVKPYSFYFAQDEYSAGIDTCAINSNTGEIVIKGSGVEEYTQNELHLFATDLCDELTDKNISKYQSIMKRNITAGDFIFRVKYNSMDDQRLYLYKKFTVAVKLEDGYRIIGSSKCITNPENYNNDVTVSSKKGSGKGVYGQSISFLQEIGATDTVVWVDIGKFFALESHSENKFECGGNLYYYNYEYARNLDTMLKNYKEKNISVTVVAVVTDTGNDGLNKILIHKDAEKNANYCAYNTSDRSGLMYLRAFCEYFGENYCSDRGVNRFVFGEGVGNSSLYNMGNKMLCEYTKDYATALRIVYNTIKSYSPNTDVYTYVDDYWDGCLPFDLYLRYDNRAFIGSLAGCMKDLGNINWGIAQNPYPKSEQDYFSYNDDKLSNLFDSDRVSFKNINVIDDYIKRAELKYNDVQRSLIIIERAYVTNLDEERATAEYVYNCYKALNSSVSAYITDRSCNYNNAMKYVDTSLSLMASHFVPDILGVAAWSSVIDGFSEEKLVKVNIEQADIAFAEPKYKGSAEIADFSNGEHGWKRYGFTEKVTSGMSLLDKDGLLSVSLGNIPVGEKRGVVKKFDTPFDMSNMPVLSFSINIASLPANVNYAEISVIVASGDNVYEMSGTVKESVWTKIYCDLSEFVGVNKIDTITILVSSGDEAFEGPQALISSINALSYEYDDEQLELLFNPVPQQTKQLEVIKKYVVPLLIVVVLASSAVFVFRRFARK